MAQSLWSKFHDSFKKVIPSPPSRVDSRSFLQMLLSTYLKDENFTETLFGLGLAAAQQRGGETPRGYANTSEQIAAQYISKGPYYGELYREGDIFPGREDRIFTINPGHATKVWKEREPVDQDSPNSWTFYTDDFESSKGFPPLATSSGSGWCLKLSRVEGEWQTEFYAPHHSNKTYIVYRHGLTDCDAVREMCCNFLQGNPTLRRPIHIPLLINSFGDNPPQFPYDCSYLQYFLLLNKNLSAAGFEWRNVRLPAVLRSMLSPTKEYAETMLDFEAPPERLVVTPDHRGYRAEQREDNTIRFDYAEFEALKFKWEPSFFAEFTLRRLLGEPGTEVEGSSGLLYQTTVEQIRIFLSLADSEEKLAQQMSSLMSRPTKVRPVGAVSGGNEIGETALIRGRAVVITLFLDTTKVPGAVPLHKLCDRDFYWGENDPDSIVTMWKKANRELEARMELADMTKEEIASRYTDAELRDFWPNMLPVLPGPSGSGQELVKQIYERREEIRERAQIITARAANKDHNPEVSIIGTKECRLIDDLRPWTTILMAARVPLEIEKVRGIPQAPPWANWKNLKITIRRSENRYSIKFSYINPPQPGQEVYSTWIELKGMKGLWVGEGPSQVFKELLEMTSRQGRTASRQGREARLSVRKRRKRKTADQAAEQAKRQRQTELGKILAALTGLTYPKGGIVKALGEEISSFVDLVDESTCDKGKIVQYNDSMEVKARPLDYERGSGGSVDIKSTGGEEQDEAQLSLIRMGAEAGGAEAQYFRGLMFEMGKGEQKNLAKAVEWYRRSAGQRHPEALYRLGLLFFKGWGVEQNEREGERLIMEAAELGCPEAEQWVSDASPRQD